jgi:predicted DNA-binding antitoxin AbrB/MazE fold protein
MTIVHPAAILFLILPAGWNHRQRIKCAEMRTIRVIFRGGELKLLEPVALAENTTVTLVLLDNDDLSAGAIAELASVGKAFEFCADAREDVYDESDGEAV